MQQLALLTQLGELVNETLPPEEAIRQSLPILNEGTGAEDVYLIYGWEDGFRSIGTSPNPDFLRIVSTDFRAWSVG